MTRRESYVRQVDVATDLLHELLGDGAPMRAREVKAEAEAQGFAVKDRAWQAARERAGVVTEKIGASWWWSITGDSFEDDFGAWLASVDGQFAEYVARRTRPPVVLVGEDGQLRLDGWA
ncbi:MAG: hypothetical protein ACRDPP_00025 [Gaiellaceae bacterium]